MTQNTHALDSLREILIIDDDSSDLNRLCEILTKAGYKVRPTINGRLGLNSVLVKIPDLILLDIRLPEINGFDVCKQLKSNEQTRDIPVLFISVFSDAESKVKGIDVGGVDYITKPFQNEDVLARVQLQMRLRDLQRHLEDIVDERTLALQQEIAERRQAEEQLLQLHQAVETMEIGVTIKDLEGKILYVNPAEAAMHGYQAEDLLGKDVGMFAPPEMRKPVTSAQRKERNNWERESMNIRKDGSVFPVNLMSKFILDRDGRPIAVVTACEDITKRKQAEETLRESEERFRATFEQAAVGIVHADPDGHFLRMNRRFCEIVGYSKEEMLSCTFQEMTHPDDGRSDVEYVRQLLAGEIPTFALEKRYIRKDGSVVWVNLTVSPVRNTSGAIQYVIGVVEDISARKHAENALKKSHEELERRVTERTFDLFQANQQLHQEIEERTKTEAELNMFNEVMLDREARLIELKEEVNRLAVELGREIPYEPVWEEEPE